MITKQKKRCASCNGRLITEYRSGGYDYVKKVVCVKCGQYCEWVWLDRGNSTKSELGLDLD